MTSGFFLDTYLFTVNWRVEVECCRQWPNRVRGVQVDAGPARHLQGRTLLTRLTQENIKLANSSSSKHYTLSLSQSVRRVSWIGEANSRLWGNQWGVSWELWTILNNTSIRNWGLSNLVRYRHLFICYIWKKKTF